MDTKRIVKRVFVRRMDWQRKRLIECERNSWIQSRVSDSGEQAEKEIVYDRRFCEGHT